MMVWVAVLVGLILASFLLVTDAQHHHPGDLEFALDASKVLTNRDGLRGSGSGSKFKKKMTDAVVHEQFDGHGGDYGNGNRENFSICGLEASSSVRVSLPGSDRVLSLAEVQVFALVDGVETNVALGGDATQSSTSTASYGPEKAIDGITEGTRTTVTKTSRSTDPWWQVDLREAYNIVKIVLWNRLDCCPQRLEFARVFLLDSNENVQATFELYDGYEDPTGKGGSFQFIVPHECETIQGSYKDPHSDGEFNRAWWAFKPSSCPPGGCRLFFWVEGTTWAPFLEAKQQQVMTEMFNRGFVAVTMNYRSSQFYYGGCWGYDVNGRGNGVADKARSIFDSDDSNSIINQLCDKDYINCEAGVAVAGFSQGAQIVSMATDYDDRVSAALLLGCGNDPVPQGPINVGHMSCMDTVKLPKQRRRYFNGDNDHLFFQPKGSNVDGYSVGREQLSAMSHYLCPASDTLPDNCLQHEPQKVADPYTGGTIENTGGYYLIENGRHGDFRQWSNFTSTSAEWNYYTQLDWLVQTSLLAKPLFAKDSTPVDLTIDLDQDFLVEESTNEGLYFEWASNVNNLGLLGRRHVVARDTSHDVVSFDQVPTDVIGFRLQARTYDSALVDAVGIAHQIGGGTFKNLSFGEDGGKGFCFSIDPEDDFGVFSSRCYEGKSFLCIDFCTDGWYDCADTLVKDDVTTQFPSEFSKCPITTKAPQEPVTAY